MAAAFFDWRGREFTWCPPVFFHRGGFPSLRGWSAAERESEGRALIKAQRRGPCRAVVGRVSGKLPPSATGCGCGRGTEVAAALGVLRP